MKNVFLFIVLLLLNGIIHAQIPATSFIVNGQNYNVDVSGGTTLIYRASDNNIYPVYPIPNPICDNEVGARKIDHINLYNLIRQKFSATRCVTLTNQFFHIWIGVVPTTGVVLDVSLIVRNDSLITLQEIYEMDVAIRQMIFSTSIECAGIGRMTLEKKISFKGAHTMSFYQGLGSPWDNRE